MKTDSKTTKSYQVKPVDNSESQEKIAEAADFHYRRINKKMEFESNRESSNKPVGNEEFEQSIAEDANFKIENKIAETAFFLSQRRDFAPGHETTDWLQAETNIEGVLSTAPIERRNRTINDRRNAAINDRRV